MAFEKLLHSPMEEEEIVDCLVKETQSNYQTYQNKCYFLKLGWLGGKASQVIWIKEFNDFEDLKEFYWDTKFSRACIMLKFHKERFEVMCCGFSLCDRFEIWPYKILREYPPMELEPYDSDKDPMIDREIFEKGFEELSGMIHDKINAKSRSKKAI